ncbi:hypothetical protein [Pseudalkalibacillus sp. JSM 102089]|uniref:hypothetical protein n=1 Tax=Pseudalkalibacillus sp. JSM 102089 TaxID=3229856 RepID=UPI00352469CC
MKKLVSFIADFIEDILIVIGVLLIIGALFMLYSIAISMIGLGIFLIIISVVDVHGIKGRR